MQEKPEILIHNGNLDFKALSKLNISNDELKEAMREHGIEYFSRPVRQDLYEHIPDIHIYGTETLLCDELTITARISDRAFSSGVFILTAKGNVIKEYYTEQLLQRGWIKGKNEKGEDFHFHTDRYDEFRFYKDGYTLDVFFDIPLDQDPDKLIWGDKRERYVITMTKTEFY